ncbi:MAG: hypothetical protein V4713_12345 [Pseudomonadota bacterium]
MKKSVVVVYANGQPAGTIPLGEYQGIVKKVGRDWHIHLAQMLNYADSCLTLVKRFVVLGPILWFWVVLGFVTFAPDDTSTMLNAGISMMVNFLRITGGFAVLGSGILLAADLMMKGLPGHQDLFEREVFDRAARRFAVSPGAAINVRIES